MSVKYSILIILGLSLFACLPGYGQKIFREGYITRSDGETINGLIQYESGQDTPDKCVFKRFELAYEIEYSASELKNFGYYFGNRYESLNISNKNSFYEVLVSGELKLIRKGSKYFIMKGNTFIAELKNGSFNYIINDENKHANKLSSFLTDITRNQISVAENIKTGRELIPVIEEYNKLSGKASITYRQEFSRESINNAAFRSGNRYRYGLIGGVNNYTLSVRNVEDVKYYPATDKATSFTGGITYERLISRKNDHLSLRVDILFLKQHFYSYSEQQGSSYLMRDDAFFDFSGLKAPLTMQYNLNAGRFTPYANGGFSFLLLTGKNYYHIRETESYYHDITTTEDSNIRFQKYELAAVGSIGVKFQISGKLTLNLQGGLEFGQGFLEHGKAGVSKDRKVHSVQTFFMTGLIF